jgi:hypothetical protein
MTGLGKRIKLRATITIDVDAVDYLDAARIQKEIEGIRDEFNDRYGPAEYDLRERRDRGPAAEPEAPKPKPQRGPRKKKATTAAADIEIGEAG